MNAKVKKQRKKEKLFIKMLSCENLCFSDVIYSHDSFIMCLLSACESNSDRQLNRRAV